jgi:MerR family redox-sensitive transcriptional activator SoxR
MKIGELAQQAEVSTSTIRYYEAAGLLAPPPRQSGRRVYGEEVVAQLQAIAALQYAGFSLAEIRELVPSLANGRRPGARWERAARAKLEELDTTIAHLKRTRKVLSKAIDCACGGDPSACELVAEARAARAGSPNARNRTRHRRP